MPASLSYLPMADGNHVAIDWGGSGLAARGAEHIGTTTTAGSDSLGRIEFRPGGTAMESECRAASADFGNLCVRRLSNGNPQVTRWEVVFEGIERIWLDVGSADIVVHYSAGLDRELIVDDAFQLALGELAGQYKGNLLHAGAVALDGSGIALLGPSGRGKSTTVFSLVQGGGQLLADDAALVMPDQSGGVDLVSTSRELSVRLRSLSLFPHPDRFPLRRVGTRHFWSRPEASVQPAPLRLVAALVIGAEARTTIKTIGPDELLACFAAKPPLQCLARTGFRETVTRLSDGGCRFVEATVGLCPEATLQAFRACVADPEQTHWEAVGEPRVSPLPAAHARVAHHFAMPDPDAAQELLPLLAHPVDGVSRAALVCLRGMAESQLEPVPWERYSDRSQTDVSMAWTDPRWQHLCSWQRGAEALWASCDTRFLALEAERWIQSCPAIYAFLRAHTRPDEAATRILDDAWHRYLRDKYQPQAMLYLTDTCQLRCPYCFVNERVIVGHRKISLDDAQALVKWAAEQGVRTIGLTGGEPTTHPDFAALTTEIIEHGCRFYLATNLLFPDGIRDSLQKASSVQVHICDVGDYAPSQLVRFEDNLRWLRAAAIPCLVRYNLYHDRESDWEWMLDRAAAFEEPLVSFAVPFPNQTGSNDYIKLEDVEGFAPTILRFVQLCERRGVAVRSAKPLPPCIFAKDTWRYLLDRGALRATCEVGASSCTRNLVVGPGYEVSPCIGLASGAARLALDRSLQDLGQELAREVEPILETALLPDCETCQLKNWHLCTGLCLSYRSMDKTATTTATRKARARNG